VGTAKASGTGLDGRQTEIEYRHGTLAGYTVGMGMSAELGPDHPRGSRPDGLDDLMDLLTTTPTSLSGDRRFIRGHLLNDWVGGPGEDFNLFPITHQANVAHEQKIEQRVKEWVNVERYWVDYSVDVKLVEAELDNTPSIALNYVNAQLECKAAILTMDDRRVNPVSVTINSHYTQPADEQDERFSVAEEFSEDIHEGELESRSVDNNAELLLPARAGIYKLDASISGALERTLDVTNWVKIREALSKIRQLGSSRLDVLEEAYEKRNKENLVGELVASEKASLTRINNMVPSILAALETLETSGTP
jgi:hypothetical protein